MPCPHFSAFMCVVVHPFLYRFMVSIKNLDLDSEYVNVGLVNGRFTNKNPKQRIGNFCKKSPAKGTSDDRLPSWVLPSA